MEAHVNVSFPSVICILTLHFRDAHVGSVLFLYYNSQIATLCLHTQFTLFGVSEYMTPTSNMGVPQKIFKTQMMGDN